MKITEVIQLLFIGATVALIPLSILWFSKSAKTTQQRFSKLVAITLFFTLDLIMFGAFTRLTDSGLGCPDWPGCYGAESPFSAAKHIAEAYAAQPTGPVSFSKAWIEMLHRYFAKALGLLFIIIMVWAWVKRRELKQSPTLPTLLFFGVCLQGAFGAWTVTLKLMPIIVTIHLLGGNLLLAVTAWLWERQKPIQTISAPTARLLPYAWFALVILFMQIALGGWVSTNYAALACLDFPLCQGKVIPPMDFANAYTLWRDLGETGAGTAIPFQALTAIHWVHRNFAFFVFAVMGYLAWRTWKEPALRNLSAWIVGMLAWQLVTGLTNIFMQWPLPVALVHNGGAAVLVLVTTLLVARMQIAARAGATANVDNPASVPARPAAVQ